MIPRMSSKPGQTGSLIILLRPLDSCESLCLILSLAYFFSSFYQIFLKLADNVSRIKSRGDFNNWPDRIINPNVTAS